MIEENVEKQILHADNQASSVRKIPLDHPLFC